MLMIMMAKSIQQLGCHDGTIFNIGAYEGQYVRMRHLKMLRDQDVIMSYSTSTVTSGIQGVNNNIPLDTPVSDMLYTLKSTSVIDQ